MKGLLKYFSNKISMLPCKVISMQEANKAFLDKTYRDIYEEVSIVTKTDLTGVITYANDKFLETTGFSKNEVIGKTHAIIKSPQNTPKLFTGMWMTIKSGKEWKGFLEGLKKDRTTFYSKVRIIPIKNAKGKIVEYMSFRTDVTDMISMKKQIENTEREIILAMGAIGENRSGETGNHVKRVAEYSYILALEYGLSQDEAELIRLASPMHDIGKVAIPDSILNKPGRLTPEEFEIMKSHTKLGYEMFKDSELKVAKTAGIISYQHHEKWDGSGYPRGLIQEEISIYARITSVCDVFDALRSERVYKRAWTCDEVLDYFLEERGKSFDPEIVTLFLDNISKIKIVENDLTDTKLDQK